jgi:hypothetical protein
MGLDVGILVKSVVVDFYGRGITVTPAGGAASGMRTPMTFRPRTTRG